MVTLDPLQANVVTVNVDAAFPEGNWLSFPVNVNLKPHVNGAFASRVMVVGWCPRKFKLPVSASQVRPWESSRFKGNSRKFLTQTPKNELNPEKPQIISVPRRGRSHSRRMSGVVLSHPTPFSYPYKVSSSECHLAFVIFYSY